VGYIVYLLNCEANFGKGITATILVKVWESGLLVAHQYSLGRSAGAQGRPGVSLAYVMMYYPLPLAGLQSHHEEQKCD